MTMTETDIEIAVERRTDRIDARFMRGELNQAQYDAEMKALSIWAASEYFAITPFDSGYQGSNDANFDQYHC